jgi:uncharacterized phage protein (TIGR01671 family)
MNNRIIKFRAWDGINKEMRYPRKKDVFATGVTSGEMVDNWDEVMQFTGLHDKDGKEIYEGDIVRYSYIHRQKNLECVTIITWDNGWIFKENKSTWIDHRAISTTKSTLEVIGNIHQHPHLLNQ